MAQITTTNIKIMVNFSKNNALNSSKMVLSLSASLLVAACQLVSSAATATTTPANPYNESFLIGAFNDQGISHLTLDKKQQQLIDNGIIAKANKATYLALSADQQQLFAIAEQNKGASLQRYQWQKEQQKFILSQSVGVIGQGSCHVAINEDESTVTVANYRSGDLNVFSLDQTSHQLAPKGYFLNKPTQPKQKARMHFSGWDHSGKFLYAIDLGTDQIKVFDQNQQPLKVESTIQFSKKDGPRHLVFHPNKNWVYVLNELSNTVNFFHQNPQTGALTAQQKLSTLAFTSKIRNSASAIKISRDGKFLYAGVRGENLISVFSIDDAGKLTLLQSQASGGNWPRDFSLSQQQDFILVANQKSNTVNVLKRDLKTGLLSSTSISATVTGPSFVGNFSLNNN